MLKEFANKGDSGAIPINADNLNYNFDEVLNLIYPIGSIIIKADSGDYSNYLGFSWQKVFAGKTLVGLDTSDNDFSIIGKTGGEKTHTLTIDEMPSHSHSFNWSYAGSSGTNSAVIGYTGNEFTISSTGGNQPHNNLQPYAVVAFWKRVK